MENRRVAVGFQPSRLTTYSRQALIDEIKRVVATHFAGLCPTQGEFNRLSRVHSVTVVKKFGSWADAMRAAGLERLRSRVRSAEVEDDHRRVTADLLLKELKSIAHKHSGVVFQYRDCRRLGGKWSNTTLCKYLGGWRHKRRTPRNPSIRLRFGSSNVTTSPATPVGAALRRRSELPSMLTTYLHGSAAGKTTLENLQTLCERCN